VIGPLVLTGLLFLALGIVAVRAPVARRLAFRNAKRRPTETALVIAGSLLGTALITGSFIVGDTLDSSIRSTAFNQLGPIDELVVLQDQKTAGEVAARLEDASDPNIDGVLTGLAVPASAAVERKGSHTRAEPEAQLLEVDFEDARAFGNDPEATGISGSTPEPGEAAITEDLAETTGASVEEDITVFLYGAERRLEVSRVLPRTGVAGFWLGFESESPNLFVTPGTVDQVTRDKVPTGAIPPTALLFVSNTGGVEEGADLTAPATTAIEGALEGELARVEDIKQQRLDDAEQTGAEFSELFLGIGSFAIVAGVLLLVNIFVMLAHERQSQLGMLRALGLRRSDLVRVFAIEGTIYAAGASILGSVVGIGVGWAIAKLAAPIFGGIEEFGLQLRFAMDFESIVIGFALGAFITTLTILFTSVRISRINIIRAIRDLSEPQEKRARTRTVVIGVVIAVVTLSGFVVTFRQRDAWALAILGPPIVVYSLLPLAGRFVARRTAVLVASAFALAWGIFGDAITNNAFFESGEIFAFVLQGILLTFSAVVFLSQTADGFERLIRPIAARNLPIRLGMAYPVARRFRTGLTLGMYALVIFTMTFISVLATIFGGQVETTIDRAAGGWHIAASASGTNPPDIRVLETTRGVDEVAPIVSSNALFRSDRNPEPEDWPLTGVEATFVDVGPPSLEERDTERYKTDRAAWQGILDDPQAVIVDEFFLQEGGGGPPTEVVRPGDTMTVIDPITGREVDRRVAGITSVDATFAGVFASQESTKEILRERSVPSKFWLTAEGGESEADELAARLQGDLFRNGVEADSFRTLVEDFQQVNLQFLNLMQGYLALGLLVGIAGLGVLAVRSVRERRREIGVLRSLGFVPPQVRWSFLFESGFIAFQGILIGSVLAVITSAQLVGTEAFGESAIFAIPWAQLTILCGTALIASIVATAWPAQQASRIAPAVALRVAE
jgi:putative ABC transport system permease protein